MNENDNKITSSNVVNVTPSLKQQHYRDNKKEVAVKRKEEEKAKKEASKGKRGRGRPRKTEIEKKKKPGKVGRPAGDAAIIKEYKARMLASPKSEAVLETILDAALDNNHKGQQAAWKLLMDRMLPVSAFEKDAGGQNGRPQIQINFGTIGDKQAEYVEGTIIDNDNSDEDK